VRILPIVAVAQHAHYYAANAINENEAGSSQNLVLDALAVIVPHARAIIILGRCGVASGVSTEMNFWSFNRWHDALMKLAHAVWFS